MPITFHWNCSYQNEVEYQVSGHPYVRRIEAYSECRHGLLEYQRSTFNGDSTEFGRTMVARQGGVMIRGIDKPFNEGTYWADHRWAQDLYLAFVRWLKEERAAYLVGNEKRRVKRGYTLEEYPAVEADPIPRPMFYNPESKSYEVEPWFQPAMASWKPAADLLAA